MNNTQLMENNTTDLPPLNAKSITVRLEASSMIRRYDSDCISATLPSELRTFLVTTSPYLYAYYNTVVEVSMVSLRLSLKNLKTAFL